MSKPKTLGQRLRSAVSSLTGKPRLDAADPAKRIDAVAALDASEQDALAKVYLGDADRDVRLAALAKLVDAQTLLKGLADGDVAAATTERLLALLGEGGVPEIADDPAFRRAALVYASTPADALEAAQRIESASARASALLDNARTELRLAVAEETWDPGALAEVEKAARDRDKAVNRLARERLARLRAGTASREKEDTQTEHLLRMAEALDDDEAHYDARRDAIERDWQGQLATLAATDSELAAFGVVARDLEATRRRFPPRRQTPKAAPEQRGEDFETLLEEANTLRMAVSATTADVDDATVAAFEHTLSELAARWSASADLAPPSDAQSERFHASTAAIAASCSAVKRSAALAKESARLLEKPVPDAAQAASIEQARKEIRSQANAAERLLGRYAWPDDLPLPEAAKALRQRQADLAQAEQACAARTEALTDEVAAGIAELEQAIAEGAVHDALAKDRQLRDLAKQLPQDAVRRFSAELASLGGRVRELRDWRTFAEVPKREALCAQMEDLADNPLEIHDQADAVKALREQWNELGGTDSRQGRELRKRFDGAAERAFDPCRKHFKEQGERRKFNLEQRKAIVSALADFLAENDWAHADWRGVEQVLRQARAEWRRYHPMDRRAGRALAEQFEKLASDIHGKLKDAWQRNLERKEKIVADAKEVRESGQQGSAKAEAIKELQRQWKASGPVPRREDQRLWKLFRAECDAVFDARNAAQDRHASRRRAIEETETLLTELERRVDIDPALDRDTVADYGRRLTAFDNLPNDLLRRIEAMLQHADRAVVDRRAAREAASP